MLDCTEINTSVIVKQVQHIGIIRASCLLGELVKFFNSVAGYWFARGESVPRLTLCKVGVSIEGGFEPSAHYVRGNFL